MAVGKGMEVTGERGEELACDRMFKHVAEDGGETPVIRFNLTTRVTLIPG